ncbi:putative nucleic acid-binding, OB-fold protein [Tanacetum coccineum]|uniref:Nucleic acid-binding, OB-fold protein n=1 Tax=Tanacetum coccineum TaxID=301880 RepID=A0ABQ5AAU1_9ASTR
MVASVADGLWGVVTLKWSNLSLDFIHELLLQDFGEMAEQTKQQATFTKINQLRPGAFGLNLTVKVVNSKAIQTRGGRNGTQGRNMRLAECLVGDETGVVVFTARNEQVRNLEEKSSGSTTTRSDYSLPDYEAFYDHIEEKSSGSTTTHVDFSQYDSFIFDLSINPFPRADRSDFYHE